MNGIVYSYSDRGNGPVVVFAHGLFVDGPISFVALAAPQIARRLTASPGLGMLPSAALGAVLLLASDVVARQLIPGSELPVGTVTVTLGGAYLIYLLVTQARRTR